MRIYKTKLYTVTGTRYRVGTGITESFEAVVLGRYVRNRYLVTSDTVAPFRPDHRTYEIDDGHLPGYRPRAQGTEVKSAMESFGAIEAYPLP